MTRYLVLGDPVVSLGSQALIPDGGLVVEDATIAAAGPRAEMEAMGPFDRVLGARALGMEDRLGRLEPGRYADLLIVGKERIFFPPGRYDGENFLDVVLDRAESADIDTVMAHGGS